MAQKKFQTLLDQFIKQEKLFSFDGESGVDKFALILNAIGYHEGRGYGSSGADGVLHEFLVDNPGAIDAMIKFIEEYGDNSPDWKDSLKDSIVEDDEDAEEDDEEEEG